MTAVHKRLASFMGRLSSHRKGDRCSGVLKLIGTYVLGIATGMWLSFLHVHRWFHYAKEY